MSQVDKVVMFQRRYYKPSVVLLCFTLPTVVPWYFWDESIIISFFIPAILRYTLGLNATWLVNSAAHMFGNRPYDQNINPEHKPGVLASHFITGVSLYCFLFINITTEFTSVCCNK